MKKILAICIVIFAILNNATVKDFTLADFFDGEISYYTEDMVENSRDLGFCYRTYNLGGKVIGESMICENVELNTLLNSLQASVVKTECIDGEIVVYAYSYKVPAQVELFNSRINLQVVYTEERCVIGWPLILGDF